MTIRRLAAALACLAVLAGAGVAGYWSLAGGRWYVVRTPSMGTAAPVGTLLWVRPERIADVAAGDIITFQPPGAPTTYSHRVIARNADGTLSTKGDVNGAPDPWRVTAAELRGKVVAAWPVAGWLVRAAPLLVGGGLLLWLLLRRFTVPRWRAPATLAGVSTLLALTIAVLRPLVGAQLVSFVPTGDGAAEATYVVTGLLPLRVSGGGESIRLRTGELGTLHMAMPDAGGHFSVHVHPAVPPASWLVLVGVCLLPAIWTALAGIPAPAGMAVPAERMSFASPARRARHAAARGTMVG
jgi:signal peptidase I